jgi:histidinol-phosphatase (PHP family)
MRPARIDYPALDGVALEISTAGLRKPVGELYPAASMLASRPPITLASDAHVPADVGRDLDRAVAHARLAGYETVTVFTGREGRQEPLG